MGLSNRANQRKSSRGVQSIPLCSSRKEYFEVLSPDALGIQWSGLYSDTGGVNMDRQQNRKEETRTIVMERNAELKRSLRHAQAAINKAIALLTNNEKGTFEEGEILHGIVKWFSAEKGFGFISVKNRGDIFVHHSEIIVEGYRSLKEGELVEFIVRIGLKGAEATQVRIIEPHTIQE